jgi:capsular polysaccharide repeat unit transporter
MTKAMLCWHFQHWIPRLSFSLDSFYKLFGFGSKIFVSSILSSISGNIYSLVIGKIFSASSLGFYSRADGYAALPVKTITGVIDSVTYPVFSKFQDDNILLINSFRRMLRLSAYVVFPIMIGLAVLAKPFVVILVTEKWLPCVVYLQVLCFARMWLHVQNLNFNVLKAKGHSNLFLKLEVVRQVAIILFLVATASFGILFICIGSVFAALVSMFINSYYVGKVLEFGFFKQLKEITPSLLYSLSMGIIIYISILFISSMWIKLLVGILVGISYYFLISFATKSQELSYIFALVRERKK